MHARRQPQCSERTFGTTTVVSKQLPVSGSAICFGTMRVLTFGMRDDIVAQALNDRESTSGWMCVCERADADDGRSASS